jgi:hypothetical protein
MPIFGVNSFLTFVAIFLVVVMAVSLWQGFFGSRFNDVGQGLVEDLVVTSESEAARTTGASAHFPIRAPIDARGVFFSERSGLVVLYEVQPIAGDGLSPEEAERCAMILER